MGLGFRGVRARSPIAVFGTVQRALPHHGFACLLNGWHTTNAPRHRCRSVRGREAALRWMARSGKLDVWRWTDRTIEQQKFRRGTRESIRRPIGCAFNVCRYCMDFDLEASDAETFTADGHSFRLLDRY